MYFSSKGKNPYLIIILARKFSKGIAINGKEIGEYPNQNEWLLNNGQKYITRKIDEKNKIIEIELL